MGARVPTHLKRLEELEIGSIPPIGAGKPSIPSSIRNDAANIHSRSDRTRLTAGKTEVLDTHRIRINPDPVYRKEI